MATFKGRKQAFAMGYKQHDEAPRLLARGEGASAEYMLRLAAEMGVPVREDADLVSVLTALDVGSYIPQELYHTFAVILAGLYQANSQARQSKR